MWEGNAGSCFEAYWVFMNSGSMIYHIEFNITVADDSLLIITAKNWNSFFFSVI